MRLMVSPNLIIPRVEPRASRYTPDAAPTYMRPDRYTPWYTQGGIDWYIQGGIHRVVHREGI